MLNYREERSEVGIQAVKEEEAETEKSEEVVKEDSVSGADSNALGAVSGDNNSSGADGSESVSFGAGANATNESAGGQTDDTETTDTTTDTINKSHLTGWLFSYAENQKIILSHNIYEPIGNPF